MLPVLPSFPAIPSVKLAEGRSEWTRLKWFFSFLVLWDSPTAILPHWRIFAAINDSYTGIVRFLWVIVSFYSNRDRRRSSPGSYHLLSALGMETIGPESETKIILLQLWARARGRHVTFAVLFLGLLMVSWWHWTRIRTGYSGPWLKVSALIDF